MPESIFGGITKALNKEDRSKKLRLHAEKRISELSAVYLPFWPHIFAFSALFAVYFRFSSGRSINHHRPDFITL
jgi:hypothetical protein